MYLRSLSLVVTAKLHRRFSVDYLWIKCLPVANFMSDGDPQVKACILCDHTTPITGASPT